MSTYIAWNVGAFFVAFLANSFIEWAVHRFIMHRLVWWIPYGYDHVTSHHRTFGSDRSYYAWDPNLKKYGVSFTWREYLLFPLLCTVIYYPATWAAGLPIFPGCLLSVVAGLLLFDWMHYNYHVKDDFSWFQSTRFFRFMKEHHRIHHQDMTKNFNVNFFPIADFIMGTLKR